MALYVCAAVAAIAFGFWLLCVIADAPARETTAQPAYTYPVAPEPTGPRCHHGDGRPAATEIAGWPLCAEHAAAIRNRKPYDQERSAS